MPSTPLTLATLEFAQTHVVPEGGLTLAATSDSATLQLISGRAALAMVAITQTDVQKPVLEAWRNGAQLGAVALNAPAALPPTESAGRAYATDRWSATVPAQWMHHGTSFLVSSSNHTASPARAPLFDTDADMTLNVLPFYLFGATDANTTPFATTKAPDAATQKEIFAKWPISALNAVNHPIGRVFLSSLVIAPRPDKAGVDQPAYVVTAMSQQKDGYAVMSAVLGLIQQLRDANGDGPTNNQYYAPILPVDPLTFKPVDLGGGLGGGNAGVGDQAYAGVFIHEQGHAFGLPHAGEAYAAGKYPYAGGSLAGSVWGYDPDHNEFLDIRMPATARNVAGCAASRQLDASGRCIKQDPMQGGAGDQSTAYKFATFSDYNTGKMQAWLRAKTIVDKNSPTGYSQWDAKSGSRLVYTPVTDNKGIYGLNQNFPLRTGQPVVAIAVSYSLAGTPGASLIYPPMPYVGNLLQTIDPSKASDLSAIVPDTGTYPWYCRSGGCDYTLRVTYADNSQITRLLQGGFRPFNQARGTPGPAATNPLDGASLKQWVINVPGDKAISRVELLDTPMVWNGLPANPTVLLRR